MYESFGTKRTVITFRSTAKFWRQKLTLRSLRVDEALQQSVCRLRIQR